MSRIYFDFPKTKMLCLKKNYEKNKNKNKNIPNKWINK